eukprot:1029185-Prorocentrum_minimum.AAC.1
MGGTMIVKSPALSSICSSWCSHRAHPPLGAGYSSSLPFIPICYPNSNHRGGYRPKCNTPNNPLRRRPSAGSQERLGGDNDAIDNPEVTEGDNTEVTEGGNAEVTEGGSCEVTEGRSCVVCMDAPREACLFPCGH